MKEKKGFIVLIAVMVTTIILTVGMGVLNLALREFVLANVGRDSVKAFYSADTGVECAFNYDIRSSTNPATPYFATPFASPTPDPVTGVITSDPAVGAQVECNGQQFNTGPAFVSSRQCPDSNGVQRACKVSSLKRSNDAAEADISKYALCLNKADIVGGSCTGACATMEVRKLVINPALGTQQTQIIADGINDCDGDRKVERSLVLTWGAAN